MGAGISKVDKGVFMSDKDAICAMESITDDKNGDKSFLFIYFPHTQTLLQINKFENSSTLNTVFLNV
jgi:hypothetical protein